MRAALLPERAVIRITGEDATHFLQGLVTSDVEALKAGAARFAALLTPQGKILFDFIVVAIAEDEGGGFVLDAPRALEGDLAQRLGFYKLRAKVEIARRPDLAVAAILEGSPPADFGLAYPDPRHAGLGTRIVLPAEGAAAALRDAGFALESPKSGKKSGSRSACRRAARILLTATPSRTRPTWTSSAASTSRRAASSARKSSRAWSIAAPRARASCRSPMSTGRPIGGVEVKIGERAAGFLGSTANGRGLAKIRLDRVEEGLASNEKLSAGNVPITLVKPDWAKFPFPGERAKS